MIVDIYGFEADNFWGFSHKSIFSNVISHLEDIFGTVLFARDINLFIKFPLINRSFTLGFTL